VPQTLVQKFGVAAVRGVARNKSIAEFKLEPTIRDQKVVDGILAQLTPDERRKFRVEAGYYPSIELCPRGERCTVSLLMQCQCCVSQVLSQLYRRSSLCLLSSMAVLVGCTSSLLCVDRAPPVGGGGPSSLTGWNCRAAIPP